MAEEFSKKALERFRTQQSNAVIRCKQCVAAAEQEERERATNKKKVQHESEGTAETRKCAGACAKILSQASFNRNQLSKGEGKSRCRECVELSIQQDASNQSKSKQEKIEAARKKVQEEKKTGIAGKILAAESELAALEAEKVTGLKPVKMSAGRGRRRRATGRSGRGRGLKP
jgi:hypothetical protein